MLRLTSAENDFLDRLQGAMNAYFGADQSRIEHARAVAGYAREMLAYIEADPVLTLAAAYLHDIGIPEAEKRHGSSSGHWQEIEGPPVARQLLERLGADHRLVEAVCELVGRHHTPAGVNSAAFRILWDADALVNLAELLPGSKRREEIEALLQRAMVTEPGYRLARQLYLPPDASWAGRGA